MAQFESYTKKDGGLFGGNDITLSKPSGTVEGDLLVVFIALRLWEWGTPTPNLTGWTELELISSEPLSIAVLYKIAGAGEPGSYKFSWDREGDYIGIMIRISGPDTELPSPINISDTDSGQSTDPTCPAVVTDLDKCLVLRMYAAKGERDYDEPDGTTLIVLDTGEFMTDGAAYEYQISAGDTEAAAFTSSYSEVWCTATVAINPGPTNPPTPDPMTFSSPPAYVDATSITMTASLASHGIEDVEYYFTNTAGGGSDSSWQDSRTYVDSDLTPDTQYTYTVTTRTKTSQDETAASAGSAAYTFPATPVDPSGLAVASTSNSVLDLTWSDNSDSYQETGIKVERSADGVSGWTVVETGPADDEAYQDTSLDSNTQYFYRVRAFITGDAGTAYSDYTSVANNYTRPDDPTSLVLTVIDYQQIDLDWSGEGSYVVERSETGDFSGEEVEIVSESDALGASTYSDTGLTKDTAYYYRVRAFNDGGDSAGYTSEVSALTPPEPPADPSNLIATPVSNSRIDLVWTDNSTSPQEDGFEIYRSTTSAVAGFSLLDTVGTDVEAYSDTSLDSNTQYWYKIRGFIDSNIDSDTTAYSGYTSVANNWSMPNDVESFVIAPVYDDTTLDLSWIGEGSYKIERSETGDFSGEEVEVVGESDLLVDLLYIDTSLTANTTYYYRVMGYNDGGDAANWSSSASAKTFLDLSIESFTATKDGTTGWSKINLAWANPEVSSTDEYYFIIERMKSGEGNQLDPNDVAWVTLVDESDLYDSTTYEDSSVDTNTKYYYQIRVYSPDDSNYSPWASDNATTDPTPEVPVADAGEDQAIAYADRTTIALDGSGSTSEATITGYIWRSKGLTIATGVNPTIELTTGTHKITLAVSNDAGTNYDDVTVTVGSQPINIANLIPEKFR